MPTNQVPSSSPGAPSPADTPAAGPQPAKSGTPTGTTGPAAQRSAVTGPVASRPPVSDPPSQAPQQDDRLASPAPWASGQVTDPQGFNRSRSAARAAGDGTHLVEVNLPGRSWSELAPDSAVIRKAVTTNARVVYDVPLTIGDATLGEVATGVHDAAWRSFGKALVPTRRTNVVRLRPPADANPEPAKLAFRRAATLIRADNPLTKIEWSAPLGATPRTAAATWPGADVVDIVGLHLPATGTWTHVLADDGGLLDWTDWATRTGKPVALHWQLGPQTDAAWVRNLNSWMQVLVSQRRMSYETMTQVGTPDPAAGAAYRALW